MQEMTSFVLDPVTVGQMMVTFVPSNAGSVYPDTITSEERFKSGSSHLTVVNNLKGFDGDGMFICSVLVSFISGSLINSP